MRDDNLAAYIAGAIAAPIGAVILHGKTSLPNWFDVAGWILLAVGAGFAVSACRAYLARRSRAE